MSLRNSTDKTGNPVGWSPDEEWVLLDMGRRGHDLVKLDGSQRYEMGLRNGTGVFVDDNTLIMAEVTSETVDGEVKESLSAVFHVDPAVGELVPIDDLDMDALNQDFFTVLTEAGYNIILPTPTGTVNDYVPQRIGDFDPCTPWTIEYTNISTQESETVYEVNDVARLSSVIELSPGTLIFIEVTMPDCDFNNIPEAAIRQLDLETGEVETISADVLNQGVRFRGGFVSTSPDKRYVAWLGGGVTVDNPPTSRINLWDTQTDTITTLIDIEVNILGGANERYIDSLLWAVP